MNEVAGISEFRAHVVILRSLNSSPQEGMKSLLDAIADFASRKHAQGEPDVLLFINLAGFNVVSSTFLGYIGSLAVDDNYGFIKKVALCGTSSAVNRRLQQFKLIPSGANAPGATNGGSKIQAFINLEEGLMGTIPCW